MVQSQELKRYFYLFLRWWWLIAICAAVGAGIAYVRSLRVTPVYTATAVLRVQFGGPADDYRGIYYGEQLASVHSQVLTARPVMRTVTERLGLEMTPQQLAGLITVQQVPDAALIRLSVTYVDPVQAAQIANAVADAYVAHNEAVQQSRYADYLSGVQAQMSEMAALVESTTAAIAALGTPITAKEQVELSRLQTTLAGYRNTYAMLWSSYEDMRLTATLSTDSVVLFEPAEAPGAPDGTGAARSITMSGIVGAMLAFGVAFLIEYLDDTLKTPDDVREALGLNTLGAIGRIGKQDGERIVAENPRSPISESYRRLRTNVRFTSLDDPIRTLLVTSPGMSEGKSVTVANLATAMAQAGLQVVVVDADLRRPRQHRMFTIGSSEGLTQSLLEGRLDGNVSPVNDTRGLNVLPSGELPPNPAELLGSLRMQSLLDELTAQGDIVLIDSPPVLPVTDAAVLAQYVDGVLLVIDAGRTRLDAARQALQSLRQVGANVLGAVLNGVPERRGAYRYYYRYRGNGAGRRLVKRKWRLRPSTRRRAAPSRVDRVEIPSRYARPPHARPVHVESRPARHSAKRRNTADRPQPEAPDSERRQPWPLVTERRSTDRRRTTRPLETRTQDKGEGK
jgi:non-specific protein-tyrosine kinase